MLWSKRIEDCKEQDLKAPSKMASGESFRVRERDFLKMDATPGKYYSHDDLIKLNKRGFTTLTPDFSLSILVSPQGVLFDPLPKT